MKNSIVELRGNEVAHVSAGVWSHRTIVPTAMIVSGIGFAIRYYGLDNFLSNKTKAQLRDACLLAVAASVGIVGVWAGLSTVPFLLTFVGGVAGKLKKML